MLTGLHGFSEQMCLSTFGGNLVLKVSVTKGKTVEWWQGGVGTIPHGYYTDPDYAADYYTGHVIAMGIDGTKVTDLGDYCQYTKGKYPQNAPKRPDFKTPWFDIDKGIWTGIVSSNTLNIRYSFFNCRFPPLQYLRLGFVTLLPEMWDVDTLRLGIDAGGPQTIWYPIEEDVAHDDPVSPLVSARNCIGTDRLFIRDKSHSLEMTIDGDIYAVPMLRFKKFSDGRYFLRVIYSIYERDDTSFICPSPDIDGRSFKLTLKYLPNRG